MSRSGSDAGLYRVSAGQSAMTLFEQGRTYMRRNLHARFGGQRQGGISMPSRHSLIFLFTGSRRNVHHRSEAVCVYVQRRADGKCEGCGAPAPFKTAAGRLYLEPHHTERLSDGGPDKPNSVLAVCPTCHRRAHYSADAVTYNNELKRRANEFGLSEAE
jgi:5-methylcytosine-specific restriction protein A